MTLSLAQSSNFIIIDNHILIGEWHKAQIYGGIMKIQIRKQCDIEKELRWEPIHVNKLHYTQSSFHQLKMLKLASIVKCLPPYFISIMLMKIVLRLRIILCLILVFKISCISKDFPLMGNRYIFYFISFTLLGYIYTCSNWCAGFRKWIQECKINNCTTFDNNWERISGIAHEQ
jgi:hypothetical protein